MLQDVEITLKDRTNANLEDSTKLPDIEMVSLVHEDDMPQAKIKLIEVWMHQAIALRA